MAEPLWSWRDLIAATRGRPEGEAHAGLTGVSIDTRTLQPGDLFVALRGDNQDGHAYVSKAFKKGYGVSPGTYRRHLGRSRPGARGSLQGRACRAT